jgi:hypothetical protein
MDQNPPRVARLGQKWPPKNTFGQISLINHVAFKQSRTKRDHLPFKFFSICKEAKPTTHYVMCEIIGQKLPRLVLFSGIVSNTCSS